MVTKPESATPPPGTVCANCGAPLYGEYCYHCGQPVTGLIRHLSGVLGDVFDTVLNIDSRVLRTLPALFLRPGFLTREYFAGRRVRYVTPFRLMFFLALAAFFVMQMAVNDINWNARTRDIHPTGASTSLYASAHSPAQVKAIERQELAKIDRAESNPDLPAIARAPLELARQSLRSAAADRMVELKHAGTGAAPASGGRAAAASAPPSVSRVAARGPHDSRDGDATSPPAQGWSRWSSATQPLHVTWLPDDANAWLNNVAQRAHANFVLAFQGGDPVARRKAWRALVIGMISVLPQTMFVLLPLFALILKIFYVFKRRLYMEHLIVALHSHAFIFALLLVLFALSALEAWIAPHAAGMGVMFGLAIAAAWIWLFVYLFLMQKRVYMQDWFLTAVKYVCVGICYTVLLSFALVIALLLSLVLVQS